MTHIQNQEQVKDCLQKVLSSSNHLLSLINDILEMSSFVIRKDCLTQISLSRESLYQYSTFTSASPCSKHVRRYSEGRASKILFSRQNITEVKERELKIQAEMSLANRKERQYQQKMYQFLPL